MQNYRDLINGVKKLPDGKMLDQRYETYEEALSIAKMLKKGQRGVKFSVSPCTGNEYCILRYGAKLIPQI